MRPRQSVTLTDGTPLTPQEEFVRERVAAGELADLKQKFGGEEGARVLRARFLEELLTGDLPGVKVHRRGVKIRNAVLEEHLDLEDAQVENNVWLEAFIFKKPVILRDSSFKKNLTIHGSQFFEVADFHRMLVMVAFFCQEAVFQGSVDFSHAVIQGQFLAPRAKFLAQDQEANFNGLQVGLAAFFERAEFHGPVDFAGAHTKRRFMADGARFLAPEHKVDFSGLQIGEDAVLRGCEFQGLVSFIQARIAGDLHLEPLKLPSGHEQATTFHHDVNLRGAVIGGELLAEKTQFLGHISNFEAVQVGRSFHARGAIFAGSVYFTEMEVRNNFYLDPVGRIKTFKTLFQSAANFSRLGVGGVFNAEHAIFQGEDVIFTGIKVGQAALFNSAIFFGGLVLKEGRLTDLEFRGRHRLSRGGLPLTEIVLNRTEITHRLTLEDIEVKRFEVRNLKVQGPAELKRLFIRDEADFRGAALHHLQIVQVDWPDAGPGREKVYLEGLTYRSITTRNDPEVAEKWPELVAWLGRSRFNAQNYQQLDAYLQRGGLRRYADKVHLQGQRRESSSRLRELRNMPWFNPVRWLAWLGLWLVRFFWGLLAGYGRKPGRVFWAALLLMVAGAVILNPARVLPPQFLHNLAGYQDNLGHLIALRLMVSSSNFFSAIPGWGSLVKVSAPEFYILVFLWFQRICGGILVPLGLAAVYTRLK